jgi:uncharacterized repeat protein (TIGR01451 family)
MPAADFNAQTDALLTRLAAAIADSGAASEGACGSAWCNRNLDGAIATTAWRTFAAWKPSVLAFTSSAQTLSPGVPSAPLTVELRTSSGIAYTAGLPVQVELSSSSPTGEFSTSPDGPWASTLATPIASGESVAGFYYRDAGAGSATILAAAAGKTAATQTVTITAAPMEPAPATAPPPAGGSGSSGSSGGSGPDLFVQSSAMPAAPAIGTTITYAIRVKNLGAPASRALVTVQLPSQVEYVASQSDRGPGCTGTTVLACDLDFLAGELVATVLIQAVVRGPGTLTLTATSSARPGDVQPGNDSASVVSVIDPPAPLLPPSVVAPTLRAVGTPPAAVARRGAAATVSIRFRTSGPARLHARVTPLRSTRAISLLSGTSLAGSRSSTLRATATTMVTGAGVYLLRARVGAARLIRGRTYLVRLTAVYSGGERRALTVRVRA